MSLPEIPFLYLRHGETAWNAEGLAQGRSDIPLNARGLAQAEEAAHALASLGVQAIVASPLERAAETARVVARRLGLPVQTEPLLQEVSFGAQEGAKLGEWFEAWLRSEITPAGGETFLALRDRARQAVAPHLVPGRLTLFVAHGALFRGVRALIGQPIDQRLPNGVPFACTPRGTEWTVEIVVSR